MTIETTAEAWRRRTASTGTVDFTMMYVAHDAFRRDLARLISASQAGQLRSPDAKATWAMFALQLHTHHDTEDTSLWPRVRDAGPDDGAEEVLASMEAEHERLEPLMDRLQVGFSVGSTSERDLAELTTLLETHMRREEERALPIVERTIGQAGWTAFGEAIRDAQGGLKAGATYLPWVLDGAPEPVRRAVLRFLPPPVRVLYRRRWEPRYQRSPHLG